MKTSLATAEEEKKKLQEENKTQKGQQTKLRELARKYKNLHEKQKAEAQAQSVNKAEM